MPPRHRKETKTRSKQKTTRVSDFPQNFAWGVATAAPQIEGAALSDGKSPSIWDTFSRNPGAIADGSNLDVACDHYNRFDDDFRLMADLGIRNYRLSISWPRVNPLGDHRWNPKGLDYYDRIFDSLAKYDIKPWVTMFHWDLPQALEDIGGWRNRQIPEAFASYSDTIVKRYGDRVLNWFTLNEIQCFTQLGYGGGGKAPGASESQAVINQTYHHALLAHGHAVRSVREHGRSGSKVGLTDNSNIFVPVSETEDDIEAARKLYVDENIRVLDPIFRGEYSDRYFQIVGENRPRFEQKDFDLIGLPTDFLGQNIYTGTFARVGEDGSPKKIQFPSEYPAGACDWLKLMPQSIYWGLRHATDIYGISDLYITENGIGYHENAEPEHEYNDLHRRDYVRNYLREVVRALHDGIPVKGYFLWSFLDNFEWQDGYEIRFGIVHTDYKTQKRTPKLSAHWYSRVISENRII